MSGRNPPSYCTLTLIAMQGHQQKGRQTNPSSNNKDKSNTIIETSTAEDHDDENLHNPSTRPRYSPGSIDEDYSTTLLSPLDFHLEFHVQYRGSMSRSSYRRLWMICTFGRIIWMINSKWLPINPTRGQLNRTGKMNFTLSPFAPENLVY